MYRFLMLLLTIPWHLLNLLFDVPWYRLSGNTLERTVMGDWLHMTVRRKDKVVAQFRILLEDHDKRYYYGGKNHGLELELYSKESRVLYQLWVDASNESRKQAQIKEVTKLWDKLDGPWDSQVKDILEDNDEAEQS